MKQPTLNDLTAFLLIAEHLNFRRAASTLGVTPSALSHTIRILERRVGTQLLLRTTRNVALTEAGARLADRLRPSVAGIAQALGELADSGDTLSGRIAITTSEYGGRLIAEGAVASFRTANPKVSFEISVDHALTDLIASGCDAGIRLREQVPPDMVALAIGPPVTMVACASHGYLRERPAPKTPDDLIGHECIRQRLSSGAVYRWEFEHNGKAIVVEPRGSLTCNNHVNIVATALTGQGIAFVPNHYVDLHLASGALAQVLGDYSPPFDGLCLYYPISRHPTKTFSAFVAHVRAVLRPHR